MGENEGNSSTAAATHLAKQFPPPFENETEGESGKEQEKTAPPPPPLPPSPRRRFRTEREEDMKREQSVCVGRKRARSVPALAPSTEFDTTY